MQDELIDNEQQLHSRAEFYLCLARAWRTPDQPGALSALRDEFAEDTIELAREIDYPQVEMAAREMRSALDQVEDDLELLQLYSRLFLYGPRRTHLNAAIYIDGSIMGSSTLGMEAMYAKYALQKSDDIHELPDHWLVLCEFVAVLFATAHNAPRDERQPIIRDAGDFLNDFLVSSLPGLIQSLEHGQKTQGENAAYGMLARILWHAAQYDAELFSPHMKERKKVVHAAERIQSARKRAIERGAVSEEGRCHTCGAVILPDREMRKLRGKLESKGLATDHLNYCPSCRQAEEGWHHKGQVVGRV